MKLKTLKDFYDCENGIETKHICAACDEGYNCDIKPIKQEAIKWVMYGLKYERNFFKVFMEFHNITEEDLKRKC